MKKFLSFSLCILVLMASILTACGGGSGSTNDNRVSEIKAENYYTFKTTDGLNLAVKEGGWWPIVTKDNEPTAFKIVATNVTNFVYIFDESNGRVLDIYEGSKENNAKFCMWDVTGADNQFFVIMSTKDAYHNVLSENDKNYNKGKENEFVIMSTNGKFFTKGAEGPVTGDDVVNAYHFIVYPRS